MPALQFVPAYDETIFTEDLEETMLNLILKNDKELAYQIIENQIENSDVHPFLIYSSIVTKLKDSIFVDPLLKRLKTEWNAHVYLRIVEILISYNDKDINRQIVGMRKINTNLNKDWGSVELNKLLSDNNIR